MTDDPRWIVRLTPLPGSTIDSLLALPLGLDVWERHPQMLVVAADEDQLAEIERRRLARIERIERVAEYLVRQPPREP